MTPPTKRKRLPILFVLVLLFLLAVGLFFYWREPARTLYGGDIYGVRADPAFSPDGKMITDGFDVWNVAARKVIAALEEARPTFHVAFSPDGKMIAGGKGAATNRKIMKEAATLLWEAASGKLIRTLPGVKAWAVSFSPDGRTLATAGGEDEEAVQLWDPRTGATLGSLVGTAGGIYILSFSPDGKLLASGGGEPGGPSVVKIWELQPARVFHEIKAPASNVNLVAFSRDGKSLAIGTCSQDKHRPSQGVVEVSLWDVEKGAPLRGQGPDGLNPLNIGYLGEAHALDLSPDGRTLAVGIRRFDLNNLISKQGEILLWDVPSWNYKCTLKQWPGVHSLGWSPEGRRLASGGFDGTLKLREVSTGDSP